MLFWMVRETAPIDTGDIGNAYRIHLTGIHFLVSAYPGWLSIFTWAVSFFYNSVVVGIIFSKDEPEYGPLLTRFIPSVIFYSICLIGYCIMVNWVGIQYI